MTVQDAARILGVHEDADEQDIKEAYHRLALVHHPDVGGKNKYMVILTDAYKMLLKARIKKTVEGMTAAGKI